MSRCHHADLAFRAAEAEAEVARLRAENATLRERLEAAARTRDTDAAATTGYTTVTPSEVARLLKDHG